jgi:hypothetical protein
MAAKSATSQIEGQSVIRVFHFADIDDGDTFVGPAAPKSYWIENHTDGVVVSATESAGTYTFTVASAGTNKVVDLFILL